MDSDELSFPAYGDIAIRPIIATSEKIEEDVGMDEVDEEVESEFEEIENTVATTSRATSTSKIIATPTSPLAITPTPVAAAVVAVAASSSTVVVPTVSFLASTDFTGAIAGYTFKNVSLSMTFFVLFGVIRFNLDLFISL